jgi:uncharacterized protein (UPF0254 family)
MKRNALALGILLFLSNPALIHAADSEPTGTEKVYRDYTEAYQKAAQSYERSAKEGQNNTIVIGTVAGLFLLYAVAISTKNRRFQKVYTERALQINEANQKVLEEIRDLLKRDRP